MDHAVALLQAYHFGDSAQALVAYTACIDVARALANRPSLILAYEPTAALDSAPGRQVMECFAT